MNLHDLVAIACAVVALLTNLGSALAVYVRTGERTKTNTEAVEKIETVVDRHEGEIGLVYGHLRLTRTR